MLTWPGGHGEVWCKYDFYCIGNPGWRELPYTENGLPGGDILAGRTTGGELRNLKSSLSNGRHGYAGVQENEANFTELLKHS